MFRRNTATVANAMFDQSCDDTHGPSFRHYEPDTVPGLWRLADQRAAFPGVGTGSRVPLRETGENRLYLGETAAVEFFQSGRKNFQVFRTAAVLCGNHRFIDRRGLPLAPGSNPGYFADGNRPGNQVERRLRYDGVGPELLIDFLEAGSQIHGVTAHRVNRNGCWSPGFQRRQGRQGAFTGPEIRRQPIITGASRIILSPSSTDTKSGSSGPKDSSTPISGGSSTGTWAAATCATVLLACYAETATMSTFLPSPTSTYTFAPPAIRSGWWNSGSDSA